jgi:MHS family metabolite:H+ symporter-like MFS transporter
MTTAVGGEAAPVRPVRTERELYKAAWASALGSALEYYDFALYSLYSALVFSQLFFPGESPTAALMASFAAYFIGFGARPIGGILFGRLGDRIGRRTVLAATILLMGASSTAMGLLPTYAQVGVWAPILLVTLRFLQGLGAGAEQAGASVLMAEYAPVARRGFFASLPYVGVINGAMTAPLIVFLMSQAVDLATHPWLWRVPFLLSIVIVGVGLWIRLGLRETPTFVKLEARHEVSRTPLRDLLSRSWRLVVVGIGLRIAEVGGSSLYQVLAVSYLVKIAGASSSAGTFCLLIAAVIGAPSVAIAGALTDRFGRIPVYRSFALMGLLLAFPAWWTFSRGEVWASALMLGLVLGVANWGLFGSQAAMLAEFFGAQRRYIGVAVTREISAPIAGGTAPLIGAAIIAWSANSLGSAQTAWIPLAAYASIMSLITLTATFFAPEVRGRDLDALDDAKLNVPWRRRLSGGA